MIKNQLASILLGLTLLITSFAQAQYPKNDTTYKKHFIGSTFFMLGNFAAKNKPDFAQLNLGYRISPKDVVSVELKTWKYAWPLGIAPQSELFEAPQSEYPGYIREAGFALVYQRYLYKGLYAGVHVMSAWQNFMDESDTKIDDGFQIFNTYRVGYHVKLFKDRFFIEPSFAVTHRPFQTEMPQAFKIEDDKFSKFNWEPGLHFGFNF